MVSSLRWPLAFLRESSLEPVEPPDYPKSREKLAPLRGAPWLLRRNLVPDAFMVISSSKNSGLSRDDPAGGRTLVFPPQVGCWSLYTLHISVVYRTRVFSFQTREQLFIPGVPLIRCAQPPTTGRLRLTTTVCK